MKAIPTGWRVVRLDEVVEILDGRRIPVSASERAKRPGDVAYFGASGQVGTIDKALFDEPLLLLGEDGVQFFDPLKSKAYQIRGRSWVNNHAHVLRVKAGTEPTLLEHYLNQFDYRGFANGTTRLKLTQAAMRRIPVVLPELDEQRRIVSILEEHLSDLDSATASLRVAQAKLNALAHSWLTHQLAHLDGDLRPIGSVLVEARGGWSRSSRHLVEAWHGVPYLKMNNITSDGALNLSDLVFVTPQPGSEQKYGVRRGDVLFNSKNSAELVGKTALADQRIEGALLNENIMRLRFDPMLDPAFVWTWFQGPTMKARISEATRASTNVAAIYQHRLVEMPVLVPSMQQQIATAAGFVAIRDSNARIGASIKAGFKRAGYLRRSLLAAAFSGRLTGGSSDGDVITQLAEEESA